MISGIDDDYLLENILRLKSFNNLFSISNLNAGNYRLLLENSGQNSCVLTRDITIQSDEFTLDNIITTDATTCSVDPVTLLAMGAVTFDINGNYLIDNYILYKALDSDNDGIADIMDVDQAGVPDTDNDGIIDAFDADADGDGSIDTGKTDENGDGFDDNKEEELRNAALADTSPSTVTPSPTPTATTYSDTLDLIPGTYVMAIEYSDSGTSGCNYIINQSVFTISYFPVAFDQDALDLIRAELVGCSATKTIDLSITGRISNPQMIDSYIWYYAADSDLDGIVDAADLDQNPGSVDADTNGIIDSADAGLTAGPDLNLDGVDDDYLNDPSNNAFALFGSGNVANNLSNGIYKVSIETVNGCIIEESFDVASSQFEVETTVTNQTCGEQGSIIIESVDPVGAYDVYWHDISDNDLDGVIDVYQQLPNSDATSTDIIPDKIDIDQNAGLGDDDGDGIINAADVDKTAGTDTLISGIDDDYLLENILRLKSFNNLFSIDDLNAGTYRLEIQVAGSNECAYRDDFTILSDEYSISNISTSNAIICAVDPVTLLSMGAVTFDIDGTYMVDSYLLYKALDTDNDGIADIMDIDQAGGLDFDNDGIIDAADVDQTLGVDNNNDGIDDSYNIQLRAAAMADTSPLSVLVDLDNDDDGIADNVDVDQTGGNDSDGDGIDDFADVDQTGGTDLNGDGVDDSIIANPNPTATPYTDTIELIPGSYAVELIYSNPNTSGCTYTIEDVLFTIFLEKPSITLSNISTENATICSEVDPLTSLTMGSVTFDIDGDYMLDSYLLYKALDTDNDGIADIMDIDQAGGQDFDKDGIIDAADVDQTSGADINNDGIDDSYNIQLRAAAMADTSPLSVLVDLDKDNDGIADNVDVDQTGGNDSDGDGIDDFADVNQTGGIDLNGDGVDDSIIANPNPTATPYTDTIELIPGSYAIELVYSNPASGDCSFTEDDNMFTILNDGLLIQTNLEELVCYGTDDASISVNISKLEPSTFYSVNWTRLDPVTNTPDGYEKIQVFSTTENHNSSKEPKILSASSLVSGKYKVEVWQNDDPSCRYEFENMEIKSIKPIQIISQPLDEVATINGTFATFNDVSGNQFEYSIDSDGDGIADNSDGGFVISPTCDEFVNDGEIKVQILGNEYLNREIKWYSYQLGDNCLTYLIKAKDSDSDGVVDYADADVDGDDIPNSVDIDQTGGTDADGDGIDDNPNFTDSDGDGIIDAADVDQTGAIDTDGDGIIDIADVDQTGGTDTNSDGIDDSFDPLDADKDGILNDADLNPYDSDITTISLNNPLGIVTYQNCTTDFINVNLTHQISQSGGITICAKPGQVVLDADASAFFTLSGGTQSCSLSSWVELPDFEGINYLKNLNEGKYKVVVTEIDSENPQRTCTYEKEIELVRDAVKYENVSIDENICLGETGVVTIDLIRFVGDPTFYYEGVEVTATKLPSNNGTIEISSYEITISPVENGILIISNSEGCNTIIDSSLIYNDFSDPEFTYTSESYELYNVIPKNELVRFEVSSNLTNYTSIEWDFGDVTSIEYGDKVFHSFSADGIYDVKLTVSNDAGCSKEIVEQITIGDGYLLMVPNVFTPNNDGKNDVFVPKFSGFINISMRIFNAYGNLLHESAESGGDDGAGNIIKPEIIPWDGSNADLNSKMYIYQINGALINGEVIEKTGTIQILR